MRGQISIEFSKDEVVEALLNPEDALAAPSDVVVLLGTDDVILQYWDVDCDDWVSLGRPNGNNPVIRIARAF